MHSSYKKVTATLILLISYFAMISNLAADDCDGRPYCLGEAVNDSTFAAWNISVKHDGSGLPGGQGNSTEGKKIYDTQCAYCHGQDGVGLKLVPTSGPFPSVAGSKPPLNSKNAAPAQTVGSYWPYATTLYDYINRAMPFTQPQSLSNEDVYSVTAYVLELNGLLNAGVVMDKQELLKIHMPNVNGFICDPRPDTFNPRCMTDCKVPGDAGFNVNIPVQANYGKAVPVTDCMLTKR